MAITSVETSFSPIKPVAVVGSVPAQATAGEQPSPASPAPYPYNAPSLLFGTGAPQFSTDSQATLLKVQEDATYWANYKVPFAAET